MTESAAKDDDVHDPGTANVTVDTDQGVAKDVNAVDQSLPKLNLDVESHRSIGMFRHRALNILHLFNIKPCKVRYVYYIELAIIKIFNLFEAVKFHPVKDSYP